MTDSAPFLIDDTDLSGFRTAISRLTRAGYCETAVCERLGVADISFLQWRALPIYREERLKLRDALGSAIDLFLLQGAVPAVELNRLFDTNDQGALVRGGILVIDDNGVARARASLFPVENRLVFSDHAWPKLPHPGQSSIPYDQVMSVGADSRWLARATVRRPVGATLDLCTGSGIHALLAASHSQHVVAVDINSRAAHCTRFNAQVTGADNIEVIIGNLFEPVQGKCFDLITANPPFVPSPVDSLRFRDGGNSGEDVQQDLIAGLPCHLAPGGIAQIVTELGERDDEPISDRLRRWLGDAPMDILILRLREHTVTNYAIGHAEGDYDFGTFLDSVHEWADNLRTQGYTRIVSVLLAFQWSDPAFGPPWIRSEETGAPIGSAGGEIEALFRTERLARHPRLYEILERSLVRRAGPTGLMEARMLGSQQGANAQAHLLGTSLPLHQWLVPAEREVLVLLEEPLAMHDLVALASELGIDEETVFAAVGSLLRRGLVLLSDDPSISSFMVND